MIIPLEGMAAAGDGGADVGIGELEGLCRGCTEQLFEQIRTAGEIQLFSHHAERVFGCDEVNAANPIIGLQGAQQFAAEDGTRGAGHCDGQLNCIHCWLLCRLYSPKTRR